MISGGLVDLQVNGFAGVDFNAADGSLTPEALDVALEAMLATGVTCCLPTVITAPADALRRRLRTLDDAVANSRLGPLMCPGYHLEGPFLNPAEGYAGCHPAASMRDPDYGLVRDLEAGLRRPILLITLAPELAGAAACIEAASRAGKLVAIGHSAADAAAVGQAAAAGASLSTHLGNGLPQILPKLDNTVFAQLADDRLSAGFIADGIHLQPFALKTMIRAKGFERAFLVTDATAAAAAPPGLYPFANLTVERGADGSVRVPGGQGLAGSSLCLDAAVRNLVRWEIAAPMEALRLASTAPASLLAPALSAHGITLPASEVQWGADLYPAHVRVGHQTRSVANLSEGTRLHA